MGRVKLKSAVAHAHNVPIQITLHMRRKSHTGTCSPLKYSIVSNDSVSGQRMPRSACTSAQADLGLRCPHMTEDTTFSHGAAFVFSLQDGCLWVRFRLHFIIVSNCFVPVR